MVILSGCTRKIYNKYYHEYLPKMPIAGNAVASELEKVCKNNECTNLNEWFNELYIFKQEYEIYIGHK